MNMRENNNHDINFCPVCGFVSEGEPYYKNVIAGRYNPNEAVICPCCGYQPGVTDIDKGYSFKDWRHKWVNSGAQWGTIFAPASKDWNAKDQLKSIGVILDDNNHIIKESEDPEWHWVPTDEERGV